MCKRQVDVENQGIHHMFNVQAEQKVMITDRENRRIGFEQISKSSVGICYKRENAFSHLNICYADGQYRGSDSFKKLLNLSTANFEEPLKKTAQGEGKENNFLN